MTTGKTIALTRRTFVGKVMSLLLNMLSRDLSGKEAQKGGDICICIADSGGGNGSPLQYSCLENPRDRGAWWAVVHGVTKNRT